MATEIWCAIIAGLVTLVTSVGTWHFSAKKDRDKMREDLQKTLLEYYEKNRAAIDDIRQNDLQEIRDDVTQLGANLQQKIAVVEVKVETLSQRVEKHNQVIERTFRLEATVADIKSDVDAYKSAWK